MKDCVIYARVSSEEQAREGFSIPAQLLLLKEYAEKHGLNISQEFYEAETAKKSGREQFRAMVEFIRKQKKPVALLVEKTDRLYRNFKDFIAVDDLISSKDTEVHLVKEGEVLGRNASSHTKLVHGLKVVLAKNYIDNLSEEIQKGQKQKLLNGGWPHKAPTGYKNEKKEIVVDERRAPFIKQAFTLYSTGFYSLEKLADKLHEEGFVFLESKPKVLKGTLAKILRSPFYIGQMEIGDEVYQGKHEPLVSIDTWLLVQRALRKDGKPTSYKKNDFKYRGLMTCGECGGPVVGEYKKQGLYTYYRCARSQRGCSQGYINESKLNPQFEHIAKSIQLPVDLKQDILQAVHELEGAMDATASEEFQHADAELRRMRTNFRKALQEKIEGSIDEDMWKDISSDYKETIRTLEAKLQRIQQADVSFFDLAKKLLELPSLLSERWSRATSIQKREILNFLCSNFSLKDGNIDYTLKEPFSLLGKTALSQAWWSIGDSNS